MLKQYFFSASLKATLYVVPKNASFAHMQSRGYWQAVPYVCCSCCANWQESDRETLSLSCHNVVWITGLSVKNKEWQRACGSELQKRGIFSFLSPETFLYLNVISILYCAHLDLKSFSFFKHTASISVTFIMKVIQNNPPQRFSISLANYHFHILFCWFIFFNNKLFFSSLKCTHSQSSNCCRPVQFKGRLL